MTEAVFQFKAIARKLNRQEQKAEFEAKNPPEIGWPMFGVMPYGGSCESVTLTVADLPANMSDWPKASLSSLAHPEWPYTGTPHEWRINQTQPLND
jgi:hypothetical protein